jgi:hypothetical protein
MVRSIAAGQIVADELITGELGTSAAILISGLIELITIPDKKLHPKHQDITRSDFDFGMNSIILSYGRKD